MPIIHIQLDSFFAAVERQRRPELAGRPIVVAKSSGRSAGVVVSASPEAVSAGVFESMSVRHAQRMYPEAKILAADYQFYREVQASAMDIACVYSPLLEPYALDKAYLDVTGVRSLFGSPKRIAGEIKRKIGEELGLSVSIGIAANKFTAGAASFVAGPGGFLQVAPGTEREFLAPLPVKLIWGIGDKTERRLADLGISTIGQLASIPERFLVKQFGVLGESLSRLAMGVDHSAVSAAYPPKIMKIEQMFPLDENEIEEPAAVEEHLPDLADQLAIKLRKRNRLAKSATLKLHLSGDGPSAMRTASITYSLKRPIASSLEISGVFRRLLYARMRPGMKVDGISLVLSSLSFGENVQLSLIGDKALSMKREQIVNAIRDRFGERAIFFAGALAPERGDAALLRLVA